MFSDRNYRRKSYSPSDDGFKALWLIIIACAVFFLFQNPTLERRMWLDVPDVKNMQWWRFLTYMFIHGSFWHIFFNMWGLYIFGKTVAITLGRTKFLTLYFLSGVLGGLLWLSANWESSAPVVGASGAVFGVMLAMAMIDPNQEYMLLIPPMPIKCKTLIIVYGLLEIFQEYSGAKGNVAHLAHLGGFVGGYVFLKIACAQYIQWDPLAFLFKSSGARRPANPPPGWSFTGSDNAKSAGNKDKADYDPRRPQEFNSKSSQNYRVEPVSPREIDRLLDKISQSGINSLSPEELATLRRAREQMKKP